MPICQLNVRSRFRRCCMRPRWLYCPLFKRSL